MRFLALLLVLVITLPALAGPTGDPAKTATPADLAALMAYIKTSWQTLRRSHQDLVAAAVDPKLGERKVWPVYVDPEDLPRVREELKGKLKREQFEQLELLPLPEGAPNPNGLLYLPEAYVVPGGRFNEMYGWDSYFIELGLLRDGELQAAADLVEDFLYEVDHYGRVLNANRTYYLTRSQPPFLSRMVLALADRLGPEEQLDLYKRAWPALLATHRFWTTAPHLTPETGLSRYYDLGDGPADEVLEGEKDERGQTHYDRIQAVFRNHGERDYGYPLELYYDRAGDRLTPLFYKGDRSMRESGFDPSNRFGAFNLDCIHYNPVDLNTLLYVLEQDLAKIAEELARPSEAAAFRARAEKRREQMQKLFWDPRSGLFFDYNFRTRSRRNYPFATTYFPLWAQWATPEQARAVAANLHLFERPGGLLTSTHVSGNQWDAPFGWAPLQLVAVEGLRRYGFATEADRISVKWLSLMLKEFLDLRTLVEKYDVVARSSRVSQGIEFGYSTNEVGFGWTNAVFTLLYDALPADQKARVLQLDQP